MSKTNSSFSKNATILFGGSMVVAGLNYLFYPLIARLLNISEFGEVQTLVSLYLQVAIIFNAVNVVTVRLIADRIENYKKLIIDYNLLIYYILLLICIVMVGLSGVLSSFFQFKSDTAILFLLFTLIINVPFNFWLACLQGERNFPHYNVMITANSAIKLVAAPILIFLGFGVAGAIGSILAGQIISIIFVRRLNKKLPPLKSFLFLRRVNMYELLKRENIIFRAVMASGALIFLFTADMFFIKHYFHPEEAGIYAGISTVARIIFFVCAPIAAVLLPSVNLSHPADNRKLLYKSMILTAALGGLPLIAFILFPSAIISFVIGVTYLPAAPLLPLLSISLFLLSCINVLLYYSLALKRLLESSVVVFGAILYIVLVAYDHSSMDRIVYNLLTTALICSIMMAVIIMLRKIYNTWHQIREKTEAS